MRERLTLFAQGQEAGDTLLPWVGRLSPEDRERLRDELALVLEEPEATGEPVDWQEVQEILQEWAEAAGWHGVLVRSDELPPDQPYSVEIRPRDAEALARASAAVQTATYTLLTQFLSLYPTASDRLPRGRLKKLKNRDSWQIDLPDGYRLRYAVDKAERTVHVIYLGPHPDRDTSGREQAVRTRIQRGRDGYGGGES